MQIDWQQVQRLLVIYVGDIGTEITFLQAALQQIRQRSTDAEITLLFPSQLICKDAHLCAPTEFQSVERIIIHTTTWQDPAREKELVEKLQQLSFNAAIILTNKDDSPYPFAYLAYLAGVPIRVGRSREFGGGVISDQ